MNKVVILIGILAIVALLIVPMGTYLSTTGGSSNTVTVIAYSVVTTKLMAGAEVTLGDRTVIADENGVAVFTDVPQGYPTLAIKGVGYAEERTLIAVDGSGTLKMGITPIPDEYVQGYTPAYGGLCKQMGEQRYRQYMIDLTARQKAFREKYGYGGTYGYYRQTSSSIKLLLTATPDMQTVAVSVEIPKVTWRKIVDWGTPVVSGQSITVNAITGHSSCWWRQGNVYTLSKLPDGTYTFTLQINGHNERTVTFTLQNGKLTDKAANVVAPSTVSPSGFDDFAERWSRLFYRYLKG